MNWRLVFLFSLPGILIGIVLLFGVSVYLELLLWVILVNISAYLIAKKTVKRFFLQGFMVGLLSFIWIVLVLISFIETYFQSHPWWKMMYQSGMPNEIWISIMVIICLILSLYTGYNAYLMGKWFKKTSPKRLKLTYSYKQENDKKA